MPENPYLPWLNDTPELLYQAMQPQRGSRNYLDYWLSQYGNIFNRYQGALGQQGLAGQAPSMNFSDYLTQFWNPQQEWKKLAPQTRGTSWNPRASWDMSKWW